MTLQQLRYADAVASCGSLSEAARRVFVTQPTLTEAIRALEARIAVLERNLSADSLRGALAPPAQVLYEWMNGEEHDA